MKAIIKKTGEKVTVYFLENITIDGKIVSKYKEEKEQNSRIFLEDELEEQKVESENLIEHNKKKSFDRNFEICTMGGIICLFFIFYLFGIIRYSIEKSKKVESPMVKNEVKKIQVLPASLTIWDKLRNAIIQVESEGNVKAINGDCVGLLQISPIYVRQCNKILGYNKYTLNDRYDSIKSVEMYNLYQSYFNVAQDEYKAIKLHNPRANKNYKNKVLKELNKQSTWKI